MKEQIEVLELDDNDTIISIQQQVIEMLSKQIEQAIAELVEHTQEPKTVESENNMYTSFTWLLKTLIVQRQKQNTLKPMVFVSVLTKLFKTNFMQLLSEKRYIETLKICN